MTTQRRTSIIRDLLALYRRYDEREIKDAIEAIERGEALQDTLRLAALGHRLHARPRVSIAARQEPRQSSRARSRDSFNELVSRLLATGDEDDRRVAHFLTAIEQHHVLPTGASLRDFSRALGITISDSKLDRLVIAKRVGDELLRHSKQERSEFLEMARQIGGGTSSLQEWSNIIVKG